ncbi:helix-turn-helix domain-containing protein [Sphingosinicella sp.]|uniref:helix-turn-helix domain-containing protein n=1 Tax=Sphingosinicella sp. TaxID=1917971 RepID=UPI00403771EE
MAKRNATELGEDGGRTAAAEPLAMVGDATAARAALSPLRRELLGRLREPGSAASLSEALKLPRQRIGYHLKVLEQAGLIVPAGERQRRGFVEHLFEARSDALIVDPLILGAVDPEGVEKQDAFAAEHLVGTAARIVRDVSRMREAARAEGSRLLTFTVEADIALAAPRDIERFTARLADALAGLAAEFAPKRGKGRTYRVTVGGHPATDTKIGKNSLPAMN